MTFTYTKQYNVWTCDQVPNVSIVERHGESHAGGAVFDVQDWGTTLLRTKRETMTFRTMRGAKRAASNLAKEYITTGCAK